MLDIVIAAGLLAIERASYVWIARQPDRFVRTGGYASADEAVDGVRRLFYAFKVLQLGVFTWWCLRDGGPDHWLSGRAAVVGAGLALIAVGQALNAAVFHRLGTAGMFYGAEFGLRLPRSQAFPFSWFRHPQYVGTLLSIWGLFLLARFPADDWYVLPAIETVYYAAGARLER